MPGEWVDCKRRRRTCIRKNAQNTPRRPGGAAEMPKPRFAQASTGENMASVFKILRILRRPHRNVTDFLQSLCDRPVVRARIHVLQLRHGNTFVAYARETRCKGYCGVVNNRPSTLFMCMEGEGRRFGWAKRIYLTRTPTCTSVRVTENEQPHLLNTEVEAGDTSMMGRRRGRFVKLAWVVWWYTFFYST